MVVSDSVHTKTDESRIHARLFTPLLRDAG